MPSPNLPSTESEERWRLLQRARRYTMLAEQVSDPDLIRAYREEAEDCLRHAQPAPPAAPPAARDV